MPDDLKISITETVTSFLDLVGNRSVDFSSLMPAIKEVAIDSIMGNFQVQGRPDKWKALKKDRPDGRRNPILNYMGILKASVHQDSRIIDSNTVEVGTNIDYAAIHNYGFSGTIQIPAHQRVVTHAFGKKLKQPVTANVKAHSKKMEMPKREFMIIQEEDQQEMKDMAIDYVTGRI